MRSRLEQCCSNCPNHRRKTHLLMRVYKLKKVDRLSGDEMVAISRAIAVAQSQPTPMDIGAVGKGKSGKGGKGSRGAGKLNNQTQQACSRCGNTDGPSGRCVSIFWNYSAQGQWWSEGQGRWQRCECCQGLVGIVVSRSVRIHHCESGGQPRHNHGWIGRKLLRCWQRE